MTVRVPSTTEPASTRPRPLERLTTGLARRPWGLYVAVAFVVLLGIAAIAPTLLATHDPLALDYPRSLHAPSWADKRRVFECGAAGQPR